MLEQVVIYLVLLYQVPPALQAAPGSRVFGVQSGKIRLGVGW